MLRKLLKYDLKWIYQVIIVFYILAMIFSILGRVLVSIENSVIFHVLGQISMGIAISMMISSFINCFMRSWVRFVRNLYADESYLTHTLPVSKKMIYASKVLSSIICTFTTVLVVIVCLFICYYSKDNLEILKSMLEIAATTYNTTVIKLLFLVSFILFLEFVFLILIGYVGIILGHKKNHKKIVYSILYGFGLYIITQMITLGLILLLGLFNSNIMNLIYTTDMIDMGTIKLLLLIAIVIYIVYIFIYYMIGLKQLEKGVNID